METTICYHVNLMLCHKLNKIHEHIQDFSDQLTNFFKFTIVASFFVFVFFIDCGLTAALCRYI